MSLATSCEQYQNIMFCFGANVIYNPYNTTVQNPGLMQPGMLQQTSYPAAQQSSMLQQSSYPVANKRDAYGYLSNFSNNSSR